METVLPDAGSFQAPMAGHLGWFLLLLAIGSISTWLVRRYALRHALIDHPGERRSHAVATPRGGGLSIVIVLLVAFGWLGLLNPSQAPLLAAAGIGLGLVAGIGWIDDHRPLSPWLRLGVHAIAAALLAVAIERHGGSPVHALAAFVLALALVNVWNFMDGIDGIAASQAGIAAIGFALVAGDGMALWLVLALVAACGGFLPFNFFPKARIFLGDVGSGALGYIMAALIVILAGQENLASQNLSPILLLLPLSAFLIDATLTLIARVVRGERWWTPHVGHAYQRWATRWGSHAGVTLVYAGWTMAAVAVMLAALPYGPAFIVMAWYVAGVVVWIWLQVRDRRIAGGHRE